MFKNKNFSVYRGPGQNERQPSGDAFRTSGKEHAAQAVRGPKDVSSRPMIFAYFSSQEKYGPSGQSVKKEMFYKPYAGGTYFLHEAKKYAKSPSLLEFCMKIYASLRYKLEGSALLRCLICGRSMPLDFLCKIQKGY